MNQIKSIRLQKGLKQMDVAKALNIPQSTLSTYETGRYEPDTEMLKKLADYYEVSVDELLGRPRAGKAIRIPVLGSVPAGIPLEAVENIVDWEELPSDMAKGGKEYFALQVSGDSMYPKYLNGDIVIVRKQPVCENGDDCVVYVNGYDATLKTVRLNLNGGLTIEPINPQYPPRTFTPEEIDILPVSIAGVVVELRRKIK